MKDCKCFDLGFWVGFAVMFIVAVVTIIIVDKTDYRKVDII